MLTLTCAKSTTHKRAKKVTTSFLFPVQTQTKSYCNVSTAFFLDEGELEAPLRNVVGSTGRKTQTGRR